MDNTSVVKEARQETISSVFFSVFLAATTVWGQWPDMAEISKRCLTYFLGHFQFTGSPCSFTISPIIKGNQPRNYQSVNYWDAAKQIQLLIRTHWLFLQDAAAFQMKGLWIVRPKKQCPSVIERQHATHQIYLQSV